MATREIFQAQCGACGFVLGEVDAPNAPVEPTCKKCGQQKMGIQKAVVREKTALDYNVFVSCKQTNQTLQNGFTISIDDRDGLSQVEIKNLFVERCAQTLIGMLNKDTVTKMVKEVD